MKTRIAPPTDKEKAKYEDIMDSVRTGNEIVTKEALQKNSGNVPEIEKGSSKFIDKLQNEVQLMMRLCHPNIIKVYQVIESEKECYIVMEYAKGELADYLATRERLSETESRNFFRQLISAVEHSHEAGVVHRDLKLENLLLSDSGEILVSDFGLGRCYNHQNLLSEVYISNLKSDVLWNPKLCCSRANQRNTLCRS